jgi:hypothetical protein
MKIALLTNKESVNLYTDSTLKHLCRAAGIQVVEPAEAEAIWVSVCDPDDIPMLAQARALAGSRPLIMGGFEAYCGVAYLHWADAVVVGEGFEFIEAWGRSPEEALALPCVLRRGSRGPVYPSYRVDWEKLPVVRMPGGGRTYFLAGRGCKNKCKFCLTSWSQPHQLCPAPLIRGASKLAADNHWAMTFISNESDGLQLGTRIGARSMMVADFIKAPHDYPAQLIRFGIEGWTEEARRRMGKPITDDQIREILRITKLQRRRSQWFFILGYPGYSDADVDQFIDDVLPFETDPAIMIYVKATYFDANPHTPWGNEPLTPAFVETRAHTPASLFRRMIRKNRRFEPFPTRSQAASAWRTVVRRCTSDQIGLLGPAPKGKNEAGSLETYRAKLKLKGLDHLLDRQTSNVNDIIKCSVRAARSAEEASGDEAGA